MLGRIGKLVRAAFAAGLLVTVPAAVTLWVFFTLVEFLDGLLGLIPSAWLAVWMVYYPWFLPVSEGRPVGFGVLVALVVVFVLGVLARNFVGRRVIRLYEGVVARIPILSSVYTSVKELLEMLFSGQKTAFDKVVVVEWPAPGLYSVGFLTGDGYLEIEGQEPFANVFLPTTPNPTTGYYFMVRASALIHTDLTVEQGFKLLMSAGLVAPTQKLVLDAAGVQQFPIGHRTDVGVVPPRRAPEA